MHHTRGKPKQSAFSLNLLSVSSRSCSLLNSKSRKSLTVSNSNVAKHNIEVDGDHCYRVGEQGLLVHNASAARTTQCKHRKNVFGTFASEERPQTLR